MTASTRQKLSLFALFFLFMASPLWGQEILIQGIVTDRVTGDPIPGATDGSTAAEISSADGGTVTTPDGNLTIEIDPGDLTADTTISVTQTVVTDPEVDLSIGPNPGRGKALAVYDLEPDGLVFSQPVTLTIRQDVSDLNPNQRRRLELYRLVDSDGDGIGDTFDALMASCQVDENPAATFTAICSVELDHFPPMHWQLRWIATTTEFPICLGSWKTSVRARQI